VFITFEGIEGSGKSTQIRRAGAYLRDRSVEVRLTREPGGTAIGTKIRALLLDPESDDLDDRAELLLYMADRVQHVKTLVQPALQNGSVVLCDRYFDATVVYQGAGRGIDRSLIFDLYRLLLGPFKPDLTLLFDLPPETGLARAWGAVDSGGRSLRETRFEKEAIEFHEAIRAGYLALAQDEPDRFRIIDAARPEETVWEALRPHLDRIWTIP
jgi:dTMP kinase